MARKRSPRVVPAQLQQLRQRIDQWRKDRTKRGSMPAELWQRATEFAAEHGVYLVSQTLGVNYDNLKKRVPGPARPATSPVASRPKTANFVELVADPRPVAVAGNECVVELKGADGTAMTIRAPAQSTPELCKLVQAFWSRSK